MLQANYEINDILYGGPSLVRKISTQLNNPFWRETLEAIQRLQENIPFSHPHFFYQLNLYDNDFFAVGGEQLKRYDFPLLMNKKAFQVGDYFDLSVRPPIMLTNDQINKKFGKNIDFLSYHRLRTAICNAQGRLQHQTYNNKKSDIGLPQLPVVLKVGCL